jgi:hypothetical protein
MNRVEIVKGLERGMTGTIVIGASPNGDDVLVNLDSVYGQVNSPWNRILTFNMDSLRSI